jgi:hypothetical protein
MDLNRHQKGVNGDDTRRQEDRGRQGMSVPPIATDTSRPPIEPHCILHQPYRADLIASSAPSVSAKADPWYYAY